MSLFGKDATSSLSSFHETSQRISPLWELLPSNLSWRPIGLRQSKWLANCHEACKYELERQYKCGARDNYVRIFFFTLLNLGYGLNCYSSRLRFAHSRAGLMAAPLQRSGEYDIFLKVVRLPSDQRWTIRNQVMSSCRLNVRIPLTVEPAAQDISPASHAPLPWRCGEPKADAGAKGSHVAADAARKNPLRKHAAPASERRSAVCKAQSLSSSLIHRIPAPHQWLPCVPDNLSFTL